MNDTAAVRFGLVTGSEPPGLSKDGQLLAGELRACGHTAEPVVWTDVEPTSAGVDVLIFRSCWAYHERPDRFREWVASAQEAGVTLLNPPEAVQWNMHKRYLRDLTEAGVDVLPTAWMPKSSERTLRSVLEEHGWERAVIKPAVGTSSAGVWRTSLTDADTDQPRFEQALAESDILVQEFAPEIRDGELSFVFLGGNYSHATRSVPPSDEFRSHPSFGGSTQSYSPEDWIVREAREVLLEASTVLDLPVERLPYARVDGLERDGTFELMELELIEPYLGLERNAGSVARFVDVVFSSLDIDEGPENSEPPRKSAGNGRTPSNEQ